MKRIIYIILIVVTMLFSCNKEEEDKSSNIPKTTYTSLKVQVLKVDSYSPYKEIPVAAAKVSIYKTQEDATKGKNAVNTRTSDVSGNVEFSGLYEPKYYVEVFHSTYSYTYETADTPADKITSIVVIYP